MNKNKQVKTKIKIFFKTLYQESFIQNINYLKKYNKRMVLNIIINLLMIKFKMISKQMEINSINY